MENLSAILVLLSLIALGIGLIKPSLVKIKTRKLAGIIFGSSAFIFLIIFGTFAPPVPASTAKIAPVPQSPQQNISTTTLVAAPATPQNQIEEIISNLLQGTTNVSDENILRKDTVTKDPSGGWDVSVQFNSNDNLTENLTKEDVEITMSDIYIALYTSSLNIKTVSVTGFMQLINKYGNTNDQMVYQSTLDQDVASQVNWSIDKATLELQILPGLWTTDYDLFLGDSNL